ncbi:MAG: DNA polymerase III subunit gamma and tau [Cryobacterium sp.]|nr:DNA polymerase III subunit gamma and tau [Cryobacterium sp.]MBX3089948.1 DNA polymerase III subunit gamma and tau [Cryobacterium sp.]MBX3117369.1 DNA polymerase III subunit gamma and tau [Cryobacterium sp.]
MATALYRRYRPETFAELIGQSQVTEPLMTALRTNRVNHAYLFSGPRGCGKTTSARILARCLNCAEGPTDTPCGKCPSCIELSRDGGGSLDVVEIDAASHNGVDDARDLRERAVFAPARDRYKIFILDEAHMVTPQGFNALLKIVEEPPEHVKFVFATTEPEKVIGTIRSRTHHYPFRLVPPAQLLEYVQELCESEKVQADPGVLSLVVRAGGGSVRDTLSLLDQLIAGSEGERIDYERAVSLLGYTHSALLGEVIGALAVQDSALAFSAIDKVIQSGQDPRRFVEDLLQRFRDLIVVSAFRADVDSVRSALKGTSEAELEELISESARFGQADLSRAADIVADSLTEMAGATSPRLQLELMIARILVPAGQESEGGTIARLERLERRLGAGAEVELSASKSTTSGHAQVEVEPEAPVAKPVEPAVPAKRAEPTKPTGPAESSKPTQPAKPSEPAKPLSFGQIQDSWPEILDMLGKRKRAAWAVAFTATPMGFKDDVLALAFPSQKDVEEFRKPQGPGEGVSELLRQAIQELLGVKVKFTARADSSGSTRPGPSQPAKPESSESASNPTAESVAETDSSDLDSSEPEAEPIRAESEAEPEQAEAAPAEPTAVRAETTEPEPMQKEQKSQKQRRGEAVVREILRATPIDSPRAESLPVTPKES